jgi:hypothetical protein
MIEENENVQIESDGMTVWVNDSTGCCIGRFSRFGIDVHRDGDAQLRGEPECLDCVKGLDPVDSWERFVSSMKIHHFVDVSDEHRPQFVLDELPSTPSF